MLLPQDGEFGFHGFVANDRKLRRSQILLGLVSGICTAHSSLKPFGCWKGAEGEVEVLVGMRRVYTKVWGDVEQHCLREVVYVLGYAEGGLYWLSAGERHYTSVDDKESYLSIDWAKALIM